MEFDDKIINNMIDAVVYGETRKIEVPLIHDSKSDMEYEVQLVVTSLKKRFISEQNTSTHYNLLEFIRQKYNNGEECTYKTLEQNFIGRWNWGSKTLKDKFDILMKNGDIYECSGRICPLEP